MKLRLWVVAAAVAVLSGCGGSDAPDQAQIASANSSDLAKIQTAPGRETQILVLSNRADLISGSDALLEIKWPVGARLDKAKITVEPRSWRSNRRAMQYCRAGLSLSVPHARRRFCCVRPGQPAASGKHRDDDYGPRKHRALHRSHRARRD